MGEKITERKHLKFKGHLPAEAGTEFPVVDPETDEVIGTAIVIAVEPSQIAGANVNILLKLHIVPLESDDSEQ